MSSGSLTRGHPNAWIYAAWADSDSAARTATRFARPILRPVRRTRRAALRAVRRVLRATTRPARRTLRAALRPRRRDRRAARRDARRACRRATLFCLVAIGIVYILSFFSLGSFCLNSLFHEDLEPQHSYHLPIQDDWTLGVHPWIS